MPPPRKCECGICPRCRRREYMRAYYHRVREGAAFTSGGPAACICTFCGTGVTTTSRKLRGHGQRFCSRSCKDAAHKAALKHEREQAKPARQCRHCGTALPKRMRADAAYCSAKCNSAAHQQTRKASARAGARQKRIDRAQIIERDGGRCHICGEIVPTRLITLDHIVPLASGGTHTEDNLAVAHMSCNCSKGARPM